MAGIEGQCKAYNTTLMNANTSSPRKEVDLDTAELDPGAVLSGCGAGEIPLANARGS